MKIQSKRKNTNFLIIILLFINCISCAEIKEIDLISNVDMFDIGLAKINDDEYYDIYTLNHEYAESILLAKNGGFIESGIQLALSQTEYLTDYEPTGNSPKAKDGLNIYSSKRKQLIIFCQNCTKPVAGSLRIPKPSNDDRTVSIAHKENASVSEDLIKTEANGSFILLNIKLDVNGLIVLDNKYMDVSMDFDMDYPSGSIFLGPHSNSPKSNKFSIVSRDNHSFAWAKVDKDDNTDVYMSTGGLRAKIKYFHSSQIINELFYTYDQKIKKFINQYNDKGLKKGICRTYTSQWVDFDNDGDLDLYNGCKNGKNTLFQQDGIGSGNFVEVAKKYHLDFYHADEFKWIDWNQDNQIDLLTIQKNKLMIYKNTNNKSTGRKFKLVKKSKLLGNKLGAVNTSIKPIDINNDGMPEIFVSTKDKIYLFENKNNIGYSQRKLEKLNLPSDLSGNLNFVDVNLDGYLDLCVFDHGIYIQKPNHKFKKTNRFPKLFKKRKYQFKNILWFDSDINGKWDALLAESYADKNPAKKDKKLLSYSYKDVKNWDHLKYFKNISKDSNNWLQIDLVGSEFNRDAIGTKIVVKSKDGIRQYRFNHGTNDSFHSQGHYRQYFGLKENTLVNIEVIWPNGKNTKLSDVKTNQLITIKYK